MIRFVAVTSILSKVLLSLSWQKYHYVYLGKGTITYKFIKFILAKVSTI